MGLLILPPSVRGKCEVIQANLGYYSAVEEQNHVTTHLTDVYSIWCKYKQYHLLKLTTTLQSLYRHLKPVVGKVWLVVL